MGLMYSSLEPYEKGYEDAYMQREPSDDDFHFMGVDWRAYWRGYNNAKEEIKSRDESWV